MGHAGHEVAADPTALEMRDDADDDDSDVAVVMPAHLGEPNRLFSDPGDPRADVCRAQLFGPSFGRPRAAAAVIPDRPVQPAIVGAADGDTSSTTSSETLGEGRRLSGSVISR